MRMRWLGLCAAVSLLAAPVLARRVQDSDAGLDATSDATSDQEVDELPARVTAAAGRTITIDRGRSSRLREGDRVRFLPLGAPAVEGRVRTVEAEKAEVELDELAPSIAPGVRALVFLPRARSSEEARAPARGADEPPHPGWQQPLDAWTEEQPLLAPARSPEPAERKPDLRGRAFTRFDYVDDGLGAGREYLRSLSGLEFDWSNPFGDGGRLSFDGEFSYRQWEVGDRGEETDSILRLSRFSYAVGGERGRPHRVEFGRFLPSEFPELGLLDGVEYVYRTGTGDRLGASLGFLPEPFDELDTGEDFSGALFYRFVSDESERVALGAAYQKSWHEGQEDRDLFLATADWRIAERTTFRGAAWLDLYGSDELVKESGLELTELHLRLDQRFETPAGVGLFASRTTWPDVRRDELPPVTLETLTEGEVSRAGVDGWVQATRELRLGARLDGWEDEVDSGTNAELRFTLSELLFPQGSVDLALYRTEGRYSEGLGGRIGATRWFGRSSASLSYQLLDYEQGGFFGEQSSLLQQSVRAGLGLGLGNDWYLSIDAEKRFGDEQDSLALSFFLQRSF